MPKETMTTPDTKLERVFRYTGKWTMDRDTSAMTTIAAVLAPRAAETSAPATRPTATTINTTSYLR